MPAPSNRVVVVLASIALSVGGCSFVLTFDESKIPSETLPVDAATESSTDGDSSLLDSSVDSSTIDSAIDSTDTGEMDMGADTVTDAGGDAGPTPSTFAGCTTADYAANDFTGTTAMIAFPGAASFLYAPKCLRVKVGQSVTWAADSGSSFVGHPLRHAPTNVDPTKIPDQDTGTTFTETFAVPGFYGFYCSLHGSPTGEGMAGTVEVVP